MTGLTLGLLTGLVFGAVTDRGGRCELLIRGPGDPIASELDDAGPRLADSTAFDLIGIAYAPLAIAVGAAALALLARRSPVGLGAGIALGPLARRPSCARYRHGGG